MAKRTIRNLDPLSRGFAKYLQLRDEIVTATKAQNEIKKELLRIVSESNATYRDDKGSQFLDAPTVVNGKQYSGLKRERRTSKVFLSDKAEELLASKGLYDKEAIDMFKHDILCEIDAFDQPVIVTFDVQLDQDEVYLAYQRDELTEEEVDSLFETSETFALITLSS